MCVLTYPSLSTIIVGYVQRECVWASFFSASTYIVRRAWIWAHRYHMDFRMYFVTIEHGNALFMRHGIVDYEATQSPTEKIPPQEWKRIQTQCVWVWVEWVPRAKGKK